MTNLQFALTSDYISSTGRPEPILRAMAENGWSQVHWCHHWNDDFLYRRSEIDQMKRWFAEFGLQMLDIHGSDGREKGWRSHLEYEREAGVELVRNRIELAHEFGCGVVIMHPAGIPAEPELKVPVWDAFRRSVDELLPDLRRTGIRIAMENMARDNFDQLEEIVAAYPPELIGICYDPGHGCIAGNGLDRLEKVAGRLIALHLNDNDGKDDLHQPPFMGKVDWPRLARIVSGSGYDRSAMSVEVGIRHSGITDEGEFLRLTLDRARQFGAMLSTPGN